MCPSSLRDAVRLRVPAEVRYLSLIRSVVETLARGADIEDEDVYKIELAVDEACTNVIEHAYRSTAPKPPLELEIRLAPEQMVVDILDQGQSFDFDAYTAPVLPDHWLQGQTRGVGLYLIRKCMDDAKYERAGNANRLRMTKNLHRVVTASGV